MKIIVNRNMKVKDLINFLSTCNPDADVVASVDDEGNGYRLLGSFSKDYNWNGAYHAEIGLKTLTQEDIQNGYTEEDTMPDGLDCVLIW
jgi:hypothetical protein